MAKLKRDTMYIITVEEVKKELQQALGSNWKSRIAAPLYAAVLMPSGAGRSTISNVLTFVHKMLRPLTMTTRPRRENEVDGNDYLFYSTSSSEDVRIVDGTQYTIDGAEYGLPVDELIEKVKSGKDCLFNLSADGVVAVKEILEGNLHVTQIVFEEDVWLRRLGFKFHTLKDAGLDQEKEILARKAFGISEMLKFEKLEMLDQIDATFMFEKPDTLHEQPKKKLMIILTSSDNLQHLAEMIYSAAKTFQFEKKAANAA
jgi:guanylate kinase